MKIKNVSFIINIDKKILLLTSFSETNTTTFVWEIILQR